MRTFLAGLKELIPAILLLSEQVKQNRNDDNGN